MLFKNYNDDGDYNLSLKLYFMPDAHMQYYDANPESSNNATFAQTYIYIYIYDLYKNVYV